jgi:hypothetical protein
VVGPRRGNWNPTKTVMIRSNLFAFLKLNLILQEKEKPRRSLRFMHAPESRRTKLGVDEDPPDSEIPERGLYQRRLVVSRDRARDPKWAHQG